MGLPLSRARLIVAKIPAVGESVRLSRDETAHARARRLDTGDPVVLLDGSGAQASGRLLRISPAGAEVMIDRILQAEGMAPQVRLFVAAARAERLSWIAEKATELGATHLTIVRTSRTQTFRATPSTVARLQRVARAAAKQCGRERWPEISGPILFAEAIDRESATTRVLLDSEGAAFPAVLPAGSAALLIGPEGGFTDDERAAAHAHGWSVTALPAGTLRTETAAIAGLILLRAAVAEGGRRKAQGSE